jgi:hypothetical protein
MSNPPEVGEEHLEGTGPITEVRFRTLWYEEFPGWDDNIGSEKLRMRLRKLCLNAMAIFFQTLNPILKIERPSADYFLLPGSPDYRDGRFALFRTRD